MAYASNETGILMTPTERVAQNLPDSAEQPIDCQVLYDTFQAT